MVFSLSKFSVNPGCTIMVGLWSEVDMECKGKGQTDSEPEGSGLNEWHALLTGVFEVLITSVLLTGVLITFFINRGVIQAGS